MKIKLLLVGLLASILYMTYAQDTLLGHVTDTGNRPVSGATVKAPDGTTLAISDSLGNFTLKRPLPESLAISHIAFAEYTLKIGPQQAGPLAIMMEPLSKFIEEVEISTGIQQVPRERATGAFSFVDNQTFNEQVSSDIISRLEAVANGLNVDHLSFSDDQGIRIRGQSTLSSGAMRDPLIILDNFPFEGDLNNINPNDVENITLLKDAAASSIWGARAANGVIVITTKRAKPNQPMRVDFNSNISVADKPDLMYYSLMSPDEFIEVERFLFANNYRFSDTASASHPAFSPVYEILFRQRAGDLSVGEADALIADLAQADIREEYLTHMYTPSLRQQYALNIQAGTDKAAWYFSAGYDRNRSNLAATNDRLTINFKNTYMPLSNLRLETGVMYAQGQSGSGRTGFSNGQMPPYTRLADGRGNALPADNTSLQTYRQPYLDTLGGGKLLDWKYYPLTNDGYQTNQSSLSHTLLNFNVNYKPVGWLALDVKYQYGRQQTKGEFLRREESYFTRDLINRFSAYDASGGIIYNIPQGGILDLSSGLLQSHNLRGQLTFARQWDRHEVNILAGVEGSHRNDAISANRAYGYNPDILTFSQVDYRSQYRHFVAQYNTFIPQNDYLEDRTNRFVSTFLNGAYSYGSKYTLSVSGRRDASNLFGVNVNDRWNMLWSAGLSWEVSKEGFYHSDLLPYLRLRATYGFSGNTDLSRSAVTTVFYNGTSPYYPGAPTAYVSQDANPELRWEKVRMTNIAVDFRSRNDRLSGSLDFFFKHGTDLLGPEPVDYTAGILSTVIKNVSELRGKGFDLQFHSRNVVKNRWQWSTNLNLSYYDDVVVQYYSPGLNPSSYVQLNIGAPSNIEGERLYAMYSYRWAGLDPETGDPLAYLAGETSRNYAALRGDGIIMQDLVNHGSSIPLLFGALGNSVQYKNIGLSVNLMFKLNYYVRTNALQYSTLYRGITGYEEFSRRWQTPGDELNTDVPSMTYPANSSRDAVYSLADIKVQRGDHIRLQYINLHYDLAKPWLRNTGIRNARIYVNVSNIGLVWKRGEYNHDPQYGYDNIPPAMTYSFGLNLSF